MKILYQVIKATIENNEVKEQEIIEEFETHLEAYLFISIAIKNRHLDKKEYYKIETIYKKLENER